MGLWSEMTSHAANHPGETAESLAVTFLREHPRSSLLPLLAGEFARLQREETRVHETLALSDTAIHRPLHTAESVRRSLGDLAAILDSPYRLGDGSGERPARDMTEQDWVTRKAMLTAQAAGLQRSIEVCDRAIELIRRAGVRTLGEIESQQTLEKAA